MPALRVVDTFPWFMEWWDTIRDQPVAAQADRWLAEYAERWPALDAMQRESYAEDGLDWRDILTERVLPFLPERLPVMVEAHSLLPKCVQPAYDECGQTLGLDFDVALVILGIGYGGWGTTYEETRACLVGLDTIAELGWADARTLRGLLVHEFSHLLHCEWRSRVGVATGQGALWNLYDEGFAQFCEHLVTADYHMQHAQRDWLVWCESHRSWLAEEFLRGVADGQPVSHFHGTWPEFNVEGYHQCGYWLGREVIALWRQETDLRGIALLTADEVDRRVRETLAEVADATGPTAPDAEASG